MQIRRSFFLCGCDHILKTNFIIYVECIADEPAMSLALVRILSSRSSSYHDCIRAALLSYISGFDASFLGFTAGVYG